MSNTDGIGAFRRLEPIRVRGLGFQEPGPVIEVSATDDLAHVTLGSAVVDLDRAAAEDLAHALMEAVATIADQADQETSIAFDGEAPILLLSGPAGVPFQLVEAINEPDAEVAIVVARADLPKSGRWRLLLSAPEPGERTWAL